jgi:hypothetical protein
MQTCLIPLVVVYLRDSSRLKREALVRIIWKRRINNNTHDIDLLFRKYEQYKTTF